MYFKQQTGRYGEIKACEYLIKNNYKIIDRNFLCRQGEIDIIAISKLNELVFIEVKTRSNLRYGTPCESVTTQKKKHILLSSRYYIFLNHLYNMDVRYDVIEVYIYSDTYSINHIKYAF